MFHSLTFSVPSQLSTYFKSAQAGPAVAAIAQNQAFISAAAGPLADEIASSKNIDWSALAQVPEMLKTLQEIREQTNHPGT